MPIYDYRCAQGHVSEAYAPMADCQRPATCPTCGQVADKVILRAARIVADYQPYECPITGKMIEGKRQHLDNLAKHGCHVLEPGEIESEERRRADAEVAMDAAVDEAVERTAGEMMSN